MKRNHPKPPKTYNINGLLEIMRELRHPETGCAWDLEQDFKSIGIYTIEEVYELIDAINKQDNDAIADELGDLLLHVLFHAQIADDLGLFNFDKVVWNICDKMIRRHPHVFADENGNVSELTDGQWEAIKATEKQNKPKNKYLLDDVPVFPSLKHAQKLQVKAAKVGFDWPDLNQVKAKVTEELDEFFEEIEAGNKQNQQAEFGDLLFSLVNYGRHLGLDCDLALQQTNNKFINRFNYIEDSIKPLDKDFSQMSLDQLDALWNKAKAQE